MKFSKYTLPLGIMLGSIHIVLLIYTVTCMIANQKYWVYYWYFFIFLDFPISLVILILFYLLDVIIDIISHMVPLILYINNLLSTFLPTPMNDFVNFIIPFLFFGILGTLWYFFLPTLVTKCISKIFKRKEIKKIVKN